MSKTDHAKSTVPYTPGPWNYDMEFIVAPDPNQRHPDIYIAEIAHSDDEGRIASLEQQDANRRLIAAAPEMFAELVANERLLTEYVKWHHKHQNGCSVEWESRLEATREVIAKASLPHINHPERSHLMRNAIPSSPIVVISVCGGIVTDARANCPLTIIVEDWDCTDQAAPVEFDLEPTPLTETEEQHFLHLFNLNNKGA